MWWWWCLLSGCRIASENLQAKVVEDTAVVRGIIDHLILLSPYSYVPGT